MIHIPPSREERVQTLCRVYLEACEERDYNTSDALDGAMYILYTTLTNAEESDNPAISSFGSHIKELLQPAAAALSVVIEGMYEKTGDL